MFLINLSKKYTEYTQAFQSLILQLVTVNHSAQPVAVP